MPTITPILRTSKTGKDGRAPLWIRVSDTAGTRFISVGEKVLPKDWDDERKVVRRSHPDHAEINSLVSKKVQAAEEAVRTALLKGKEPTAEGVKRAVRRGKKRQDFYDFAEQAITGMERKGQADSARRYRHVVFTKFKASAGSPLPFDRIDVRLLREWETAMVEKGNAASTVATAFRAVRSIYNKAVSEGLVEAGDSPFLRFRPAPVPRKKKEKLSDKEMRAIEEADLPEDGIRRHARDAFVFSFYCAGMRFKDVCLLRRSDLRRDGDGWRLHYSMSKTSDTFALKVPGPAVEIAERYGLGDPDEDPDEHLFPFLRGENIKTPEKLRRVKDSRNVSVNKQLKIIAEKVGVKKNVSMHVARHTFASLAQTRGIAVHAISGLLGHEDLKTTVRYLADLDQAGADSAMDEMFGGGR
jgi:integrase